MERLLRLRDIQERYGVTRQTASKYMRTMAHMENPLRVTESALCRWEEERTKHPEPAAGRKNATLRRSAEPILRIERRK